MYLQSNMKSRFERTRRAFHLIHFNRTSFWGFQILYKLATVAIMLPLMEGLISLTLNVSGYPYLTMENVGKFFLHPFVIGMILLGLILITFYTIIDASAVLYLMDRSYQHKKVTVLQTFLFALKNTRRVFKKQNIGIFFHVIMLLPYISLGALGIIYTTVMIPNFIASALEKNKHILIIVGAVLAGTFVILLKRIFSFQYFTLENKDYSDAVKESRKLSHGKRVKDGALLLTVQLSYYFLSFIVFALGVVLVLAVAKIFSELHLLNYVYTSAVWSLIMVVIILTMAIATPLSVIAVTTLFFLHKESKKEAVVHASFVVERHNHRLDRRVHFAEVVLLVATLSIVTVLIYKDSTQKVNPQIEYIRTMEVTAHRGASAFYPENTMSAFQGAMEFGADWIELDVQQSKDRKIFVMHDKSFFRTTGVRKMSWELDYREIAELDAGSFFGPNFEGERIPLLSEVIDFAKENNLRLNIELKPGSQDIDMEKQVVDEILQKDFVDSCVVTSQVYECLKKVKEYDENIRTVYVCSFAYGNMVSLTAADAFSVEAASITPGMVSRIHNAGKQILAWTVNSRKRINRMIDLNVDNIITDRVALAQECIYDSKTSSVVKRYVELLREYR